MFPVTCCQDIDVSFNFYLFAVNYDCISSLCYSVLCVNACDDYIERKFLRDTLSFENNCT